MRILHSTIFFLLLGCIPQHHSDTIALDLSNQKLSSIPDSVFLLTKLESLNLGNSFIFYPPLSALASEDKKSDSMNKITRIPDDIARLHNLRFLSLCANDLKTLTKEIIKLDKLDTLDISFNEHLSLATEIDVLKKLDWLKFLNIVAIKADSKSIDELRISLQKTKIIAKIEDLVTEDIDK